MSLSFSIVGAGWEEKAKTPTFVPTLSIRNQTGYHVELLGVDIEVWCFGREEHFITRTTSVTHASIGAEKTYDPVRVKIPLSYDEWTAIEETRLEDSKGDIHLHLTVDYVFAYYDKTREQPIVFAKNRQDLQYKIPRSEWMDNVHRNIMTSVEVKKTAKDKLEEMRRALGVKTYDEVIDEAHNLLLKKHDEHDKG